MQKWRPAGKRFADGVRCVNCSAIKLGRENEKMIRKSPYHFFNEISAAADVVFLCKVFPGFFWCFDGSGLRGMRADVLFHPNHVTQENGGGSRDFSAIQESLSAIHVKYFDSGF